MLEASTHFFHALCCWPWEQLGQGCCEPQVQTQHRPGSSGFVWKLAVDTSYWMYQKVFFVLKTVLWLRPPFNARQFLVSQADILLLLTTANVHSQL